jgi:hypothetical protein
MTVSPNPIAMTIISEQRREEQLAQASRYRLATLGQGNGGNVRRHHKIGRHAMVAVIELALALVAGDTAAEVLAPQDTPSHVSMAADSAGAAQAGDYPDTSALQKVREAAP